MINRFSKQINITHMYIKVKSKKKIKIREKKYYNQLLNLEKN